MITSSNRFESTIVAFIYVLFALAALLPLAVSYDFYFPYVTLRGFAFRFIVELQMLLLCVLAWKNPAWLPRFKLPLVSLMIFISVMTLAALTGADPARSLWGNFERMDGLASLVHFLGFALVAVSVFRSKKQWAWAAHFSLAAAFIIACYGLWQLWVQPVQLISSTLGNSSYLAIYCIFHIFIAALFWLNNKGNLKVRLMYAFLMLSFMFIIYNTGSRGSFVALLAGSLIAVLCMESLKQYKKLLLISFLALVILGGVLWSFKKSAFVRSNVTLSRIVDLNQSTGTRSRLWQIALSGIKARPLSGWGQENFEQVVDKHYVTSLGDAENWFDRSHNSLLDWTVSGGVFGGLSFLLIFIMTLFYLWKRNEPRLEKALLTGIISSYFIFNLFMFDNLCGMMLFIFILAYVSKEEGLEKKPNRAMLGVVSLLCLFFVYNFLQINLPAFSTSYKLGKATYYARVNKDRSYLAIKDLLNEDSFGNREVIEQLVFLTSYLFPQDQFKIDFALKQLENYPASFKREYLRFMLLELNKDSGIKAIEQNVADALIQSPGRQIIYYELIRHYLNLTEYKKALETSKAVYELDPSINRSRVVYALCLIYDNQVSKSDDIIKDVPLSFYASNNLFIEAYAGLKRRDKIIEHLHKAIKNNALNADNYTRLGLMYSESGQEEEAQKFFKKAQAITQEYLLKNTN